MDHLETLKQLTARLEDLTAREVAIREARGVPDGVPIITRAGDTEIEQLVADREAYDRDWAAYVAERRAQQ